MQTRELDHATIAVANTTNISGTVTADEMNRSLRTAKEVSFWRNACSTVLGFLMAVGLLVALAPMPARADAGGVPQELAALKTQVAALQSQLNTQQGQITTLQSQVGSLQTSNATLQSQLAAVQSNKALLLGPFVSVNPNGTGPDKGVTGPNIYFSGANIHIVSGSGSTNDNGNASGLGNLIIGYDEDPALVGANPLAAGDRGGSHNLVIGRWHRFTRAAFGGFVAGELNVISNQAASVSGGLNNTASGFQASVSGGVDNTASTFEASVSGGQDNIASGDVSNVSGGQFNIASGPGAHISGGNGNTASGVLTSVLGGQFNTADGDGAPTLGATVVGGQGNTAGGNSTVVIGGLNLTDNTDFSIAPQPPFP